MDFFTKNVIAQRVFKISTNGLECFIRNYDNFHIISKHLKFDDPRRSWWQKTQISEKSREKQTVDISNLFFFFWKLFFQIPVVANLLIENRKIKAFYDKFHVILHISHFKASRVHRSLVKKALAPLLYIQTIYVILQHIL